MARILTVGEIMMRLQPSGYKRFAQANSFDAEFGGGEANVAVSLANYGEEVGFVSKLPKNPIADKCINQLRGLGVDTSLIARGGDRIGIYFCEKGFSVRASNVVYDRAGASITTIETADFKFDEVLNGCEWLHFTGITPAVADKTAVFTEELLKAAKAKGV
jgi:2-dehydro-3-deoxygluconokinase